MNSLTLTPCSDFYVGWLGAHFKLHPDKLKKDAPPIAQEAIDVGWNTYNETVGKPLAPLLLQIQIGDLHQCLLEEIDKGHIILEIS